jgi:hypothetical protein
MRCPFCIQDCDDAALVCRACGRDLAVPEHVQNEHDELVRKRDTLRLDLERARAELERYRARRLRRVRAGS